MVQRRPLVLVSGAPSQLPPGDTLLVPSGTYSDIVAGSGLVGGGSIANNIRLDVALASAASGLVFTSDNKLSLDGYAEVTANAAIASGNAALADVQAAQASGNAALLISVEALASGNAALTDASTAQASGNAALVVAVDALASGNAGLALSADALASGNYAVQISNQALASGNAALVITPEALASGNAALLDIANSPCLSQGEAIGLIIALS
jgi:trimeric autotransporter adhesin